ncbi:MAG TPA: alpha/beta hydrolase [Gemmatimonadaceae bacterium]|nr:alpha/beta hydrolase [Gemmatimonadaceae bacterium]
MRTHTLAVALTVGSVAPAVARARAEAATLDADITPRFADASLSTGVRLRYAERGDPAGPAVILLHGYSDSWFSYSRVLPLLPARLHVYAVDVRGHGGSDRPPSGYAMREMAADILAFMDAVGVRRATVVGHSMGSFIAQQMAVVAPARVERLVLVGTSTAPRTFVGFDDLRQAVEALRDPVDPAFAREFQESTVHQPIPAAFMERAIAESLTLPAYVWHGVMAGMLATGPVTELGAARVPTLILWGERDAFCSRAEQDALLALVPHAELRVYPETGHALHWERPERFVQDLTGFMAADAVRRSPHPSPLAPRPSPP